MQTIVVAEGMALSVPDGVDLSREALEAARLRRGAEQDARVEEITREYERAMAERQGAAEFRVDAALREGAETDEVGRKASAVLGGLAALRPPAFFVTGAFGSGKTSVAQLVMARWTRLGRRGHFVSEVDYFRSLREAFDGGDVERVMRPMTEADLLVIDDLGKSAPAPWKVEELFRVVDCRWRNRMRTVVTSNLSPDQLARLWGGDVTAGAVASRLASFRLVHMGGEDRRRNR